MIDIENSSHYWLNLDTKRQSNLGVKLRQVSIIAIMATLATAPAIAQSEDNSERPETQETAVELAPVDVIETAAPEPAYSGFDPIDTGLSVIGETAIQNHESGSGDLLDVLRLSPNVRLGLDQFSVRQDDLQDLRPSDISISGGQIYDNSFRIDGVAVNNVHDVTETNPFNFNEVAGSAAQTMFLDPSLISALELRDSNVSARYGDFSGGVVDAIIREPSDRFGATLRFGYESDDLVDYIYDDSADLSEADVPPSFVRWRAYGTVDLPINERFGLLLGLGQSQSEVDYEINETYGGGFRGNNATSNQYLVKGTYDFSDTLRLTGSVVYSPYESEAANRNGINNLIVTKGGGLTSKLGLDGEFGETSWNLQASYVFSEMSRTAPTNHFSWDSDAPSIDFCTSTNCSVGGFGDLDQDQRDFRFEASLTRPLFGGQFSAGGELSYTDANKARPEENRAYSRGDYNPNTVCADPNDITCIDGEIALSTFFAYLPYDAQAEIAQTSAWIEHSQEFGPLEIRAGLRASRDDFLENTEIAPRLSAVWSVTPDWQITAGANRYYSGDFVGYAIRSQYPDSYRYTRTATRSGTDLIYSPDDWRLNRIGRIAKYRPSELDTPYSDEFTAAVTFPLLTGVGRVKGVQRWHRDQIVRLPRERVQETVDGATFTRTVYFPSNEGATDYVGISAEWTGAWRNHALTVNANWSDTTSRAENDGTYFDELDPEELAEDFVLYQGEILSLGEVQQIAQREDFATPFVANTSLQSAWFNDALNTTLWLYYRGEYETIADTGANETIDGQRYDVFDIVTRDASLRSDFNVTYDLPETSYGQVELEMRISNIFNDLPNTDVSRSFPYQRGRSFWFGVNYKL